MDGQTQRMLNRVNANSEAKKRALMEQAKKASGHAPNFQLKEGELLEMKMRVDELVKSNNSMVKVIRRFEDGKIDEKASEAHYMMQVILAILVEKGITTEDYIGQLAKSIQEKDMGLVDKPEQVVALGDTMMMNFRIFHQGQLVEEEMRAPLAYLVGSKGLSCEDGFIGMQKGESRTLDVVFGENYRVKDLVGKTLQMQVLCNGVKIMKQE